MSRLLCAPGNPGTAQCADNVDLSVNALEEMADFAQAERIDLTVVGPEAPLCAGIQQVFAERGLTLFGPSREAAELEGSKAYAKEFMRRHQVPTADFGVFDSFDEAARYIEANGQARVVKADGLAAGKGVFVCGSAQEACDAAQQLLEGQVLGGAGRRVIVEQRIEGEEVSIIALSDGQRVVTLASSQDHKPALDGDRGPNTGGMGAYSPASVLTPDLERQVHEQVLQRTIQGLAAEGRPFRGVLYAGLMVLDGRPLVLEFNCRFGDPETQPLMARFDDDLLPYLMGAAKGELPTRQPKWDRRAALCVVMASGGYPGAYDKGKTIQGLANAEKLADVVVFHAGTAMDSAGQTVTAGGRVLGVTALGSDLAAAQRRAYEATRAISWDGVHFRGDIGHRGIARQR